MGGKCMVALAVFPQGRTIQCDSDSQWLYMNAPTSANTCLDIFTFNQWHEVKHLQDLSISIDDIDSVSHRSLMGIVYKRFC